MNKMMIATAVAAMGALSASATLIVDVDGASNVLSGTTHTFEANQAAGGMPNVGGRFKDVTLSGTDRIGTTGTLSTKTDFYLHWSGMSPSALSASTYKYAKIDFSLSGGWASGTHKFRLGDTVTVTGSSGANDVFSNPELLNTAAARADGVHSFIVDLTADTTYAGDWKYIRWNFYNTSANNSSVDASAEKKLTIDKITYGTSITAIPEPATLGLLSAFGGAILFIRRRFMI